MHAAIGGPTYRIMALHDVRGELANPHDGPSGTQAYYAAAKFRSLLKREDLR